MTKNNEIQASTNAAQNKQAQLLPLDFSLKVMAKIELEQSRRDARKRILLNALYCFVAAVSMAGLLYVFDLFHLLSLRVFYYQGIATASSLLAAILSSFSSSFTFFVNNRIMLITLLCIAVLGTIGQMMLKSQQAKKQQSHC